MKKIISLLLTFCLILSFSVVIFAQTQIVSTPIYLEDKQLEFENPVLNIDGTTYYPMRSLLNEVGVNDNNILWDAETKTITIYANNTITIFGVGSSIAVENGEYIDIVTPPIIYDSSTYLPIRPVARACGFNIFYNEALRTIHLTY